MIGVVVSPDIKPPGRMGLVMDATLDDSLWTIRENECKIREPLLKGKAQYSQPPLNYFLD